MEIDNRSPPWDPRIPFFLPPDAGCVPLSALPKYIPLYSIFQKSFDHPKENPCYLPPCDVLYGTVENLHRLECKFHTKLQQMCLLIGCNRILFSHSKRYISLPQLLGICNPDISNLWVLCIFNFVKFSFQSDCAEAVPFQNGRQITTLRSRPIPFPSRRLHI